MLVNNPAKEYISANTNANQYPFFIRATNAMIGEMAKKTPIPSSRYILKIRIWDVYRISKEESEVNGYENADLGGRAETSPL